MKLKFYKVSYPYPNGSDADYAMTKAGAEKSAEAILRQMGTMYDCMVVTECFFGDKCKTPRKTWRIWKEAHS